MKRRRIKIIASLLVFAMTFSYFSIIKTVIASSLEDQTSNTNQANVEFDAYFMKNNQKTHSDTKNIEKENSLYITITVKNAGYLKNAELEMNNTNFKIQDNYSTKEISKIEDNKIYFNQINKGNTITVAIPIQIIADEEIDLNEFNKENVLKFTGTYVDGNGKEKEVEKNTTVKLAWTAEKQAELNIQVSKFFQLNTNNKKYVILQNTVQSYLKDNILPVQKSKIEIIAPSIYNKKPDEIKVIANTTKATNGDEQGLEFGEDNYTYDKTTGKILITINNEAYENQVEWKKNAIDELIVTYIYWGQEITGANIPVTIKANSNLSIYETSITNATKTVESQTNLTQPMGELVDLDVKTTEILSKGQIYANYETTAKKETEYKEKITTNIGLIGVEETNIIDKIQIELNADNFICQDETKAPTTVAGNNYVYFKEIKISKDNFEEILSEEGYIKIYNGTTLIGTIDKNIQEDEEWNLKVDLKELNVNNIRIETSIPEGEGKLELELTKAIKGEIDYSKAQAKTFTKIETEIKAEAIKETTKVVEKTITKEIMFTEPTSQAEIVIDNNNLSTVVTNQNVKITGILKTDTLNCNLYKNPTLKITLPKDIEEINIKNVEVLFDTEGSRLTLKNKEVKTNEDGTKTIEIQLEGMQTEYAISAVAKGVNVVVTVDITVNKLTPNKEEEVKMVYTNESTAETNETSTKVKFVAPVGVVTTTTMSNYKENGESLTSISGEAKVATIETRAEARNVKFEMTVINNYNNTIDNISVLGRIPSKQNKEVTTGNEMGSTMDMPLVSNIVVKSNDNNKVAVYYSEKVDATKDITLASNGWTLTPTSIDKVKSYLIVLTDYTMNTGDSINFAYEAQIPANLQYNESSYENYAVYFNNNLATGTIQDKSNSAKTGVTTGKGPAVEATLESNVQEAILAGNIIKYTITAQNTGTKIAENVIAKLTIPEEILTYVEEDKESSLGYKYGNSEATEININFGQIKENQTVKKEIWFKTSYITEEQVNIELKATITGDNIKQIETNTVTNTIKKAYYRTSAMEASTNSEITKENSTYKIIYLVKTSTVQTIAEDTIITVMLPKELNYESINAIKRSVGNEEGINTNIQYDKNTGKLTINLGQLNGESEHEIQITTKVGQLEENIYEKEVVISATIRNENTTKEKIKDIKTTINKPGLEVVQTASIPNGSRINVGEDFSYIIEMKNLSNITMNNIEIVDYLPEELTYKNSKITYSNGLVTTSTKETNEGRPNMQINLEGKASAKLELMVSANIVTQDTTIENKAIISHKDLKSIETNSIKHVIEKYDREIEYPQESEVKRIMGQVWEDENKDGIKDIKEKKIKNVEVLLFNNQTGKLVTDETGNILKAITDEDGNYTFSKVTKGKYTIIFLYDVANFSSTTYRKEGVDNTRNSDAIDSKITVNGEERIAGITEEINVKDSNVYNIDLGLISNPKFDLKLDKTVTQITVQSGKETTTYAYNDVKLAKKDLIGKDINNTSIIVEYKLKVTNEGAISGYVKKLVDYMPSQMKFNSELNKDWYSDGNGTLYNSSLANVLINPGESKEVTLTLTKKMTEDNLGLYNNTAEIYEAYNDLAIQDMDSTPGNKANGEDDISSADVLITLKTGEVIIIATIAVIAIITVSVATVIINKKIVK